MAGAGWRVAAVNEQERHALVEGRYGDPHRVLGPHPVDGGTFVRVRDVRARSVAVVWEERAAPLASTGDGVFEGVVPAALGRYQLDVVGGDGVARRIDDAYRFPPTVDDGKAWLFKAGQLEDTASLLGARPATVDGVEGFAFAVWAPNARGVAVVGDFCDWDDARLPMRMLHAALWELFVPGARAGQHYMFSVLGADDVRVRKADPCARAAALRPEHASRLVGDDDFAWRDAAFLHARATQDPLAQPLSIYEVHLPSWRRNADGSPKSYRQLADELVPHVAAHGFDAVEIVGLAEHPLDDSWGYQVTGYYAPTARHGSPVDLKHLVDAMHAAGVKVIYDWVPAHFPKDAFGLARFDGTHLYDHEDARLGEHRDWGTRIFHYGRPEVRSFLVGSLVHFLDEFHLDGVRVDAVASMLYLDYSRTEWIPNDEGGNLNKDAISFLREVNARIAKRFPGVLKIAEESTSFPGVTKPVDEGGLGFDLKWNMGWMHDTLKFFETHPDDRPARLDALTNTLLWAQSERFVAALSHDEVVHLKRSLKSKMPGDDWQQRANLRLLLGYTTSYPGQKLLFMGTELAQSTEWDFRRELPWGEGDAGTARLLGDLNRLYRSEPALARKQHAPDGTELRSRDELNGVVAIVRKGEQRADDVVFVHNLTAHVRRGWRVGVDEPGRYDEVLNTDAAIYGGSDVGNLGGVDATEVPMHGSRWSIEVTLPPLATLAFKKRR